MDWLIYALIGTISLVASVNALQPLVVRIYVVILGLFMLGILKEEVGKETLGLKFAAVILVFTGMYLIT